jgi:hypothetical protein
MKDLNMNASKFFLASALLFSGLNASASENIIGKYETVTESDCNFSLTLSAKGRGNFVQICSREEEESNKFDIEKRKITWTVKGDVITVKGISKSPEKFTIHPSLSCEVFGGKGSSFGVHGYKNDFWKAPSACK